MRPDRALRGRIVVALGVRHREVPWAWRDPLAVEPQERRSRPAVSPDDSLPAGITSAAPRARRKRAKKAVVIGGG